MCGLKWPATRNTDRSLSTDVQFPSGGGTTNFPSLPTITPPPGCNNVKITPQVSVQVTAQKTLLKILPEKTTVMTSDYGQNSEAAILGSKRLIKEIHGVSTYAIRFQKLWDLSNKP